MCAAKCLKEDYIVLSSTRDRMWQRLVIVLLLWFNFLDAVYISQLIRFAPVPIHVDDFTLVIKLELLSFVC